MAASGADIMPMPPHRGGDFDERRATYPHEGGGHGFAKMLAKPSPETSKLDSPQGDLTLMPTSVNVAVDVTAPKQAPLRSFAAASLFDTRMVEFGACSHSPTASLPLQLTTKTITQQEPSHVAEVIGQPPLYGAAILLFGAGASDTAAISQREFPLAEIGSGERVRPRFSIGGNGPRIASAAPAQATRHDVSVTKLSPIIRTPALRLSDLNDRSFSPVRVVIAAIETGLALTIRVDRDDGSSHNQLNDELVKLTHEFAGKIGSIRVNGRVFNGWSPRKGN